MRCTHLVAAATFSAVHATAPGSTVAPTVLPAIPAPTTMWKEAIDGSWVDYARWSDGAPCTGDFGMLGTFPDAGADSDVKAFKGYSVDVPGDLTHPIDVLGIGLGSEVRGAWSFRRVCPSSISCSAGSGFP